VKQPTHSNILITLIEGDSRLWSGLEVSELFYVGESAEYENEAGMLEDALGGLFKPEKPGEYFLHGFQVIYSKDYLGEVDADYSLEGWRIATLEDTRAFRFEMNNDSDVVEVELATPRPYQEEGAEFLFRARKAILADEQGTGKTGQAYRAWVKAGRPGPAVILARANAQVPWLVQAPAWGVQTPLVIRGTPQQRAKAWADIGPLDIVTMTPEAFMSDVKRKVTPRHFPVVIYDQYQRLLVNRKTDFWKFMNKEITKQADYLFLLSGSPLRRGFQDLWAPLHLCAPHAFSSYWKMVQTFGLVVKDHFGGWNVEGLLHKEDFAKKISPHYLRREKADILPWLPAKTRIISDVVISMLPKQQKMYDALVEDMLLRLEGGELLIVPSQLALLTRLRQILVTPRILDPQFEEYGALLELLGEMMDETEDLHFVIYTPFTDAIDTIRHFLHFKKRVPLEDVTVLRGGMKVEEMIAGLETFKERRGICICSLAYAEAFDLVPATWAFFLGFSYTPEDNKEAEDRIHRFTTTQPVTYYYPTHVGGVDNEIVLPILDFKTTELHKITRTTKALREFLQKSRERRYTR
jgi:SWI/SNF-related matrix-associated actin-dependent regulator of chromatin subfamily A-like protein 1